MEEVELGIETATNAIEMVSIGEGSSADLSRLTDQFKNNFNGDFSVNYDTTTDSYTLNDKNGNPALDKDGNPIKNLSKADFVDKIISSDKIPDDYKKNFAISKQGDVTNATQAKPKTIDNIKKQFSTVLDDTTGKYVDDKGNLTTEGNKKLGEIKDGLNKKWFGGAGAIAGFLAKLGITWQILDAMAGAKTGCYMVNKSGMPLTKYPVIKCPECVVGSIASALAKCSDCENKCACVNNNVMYNACQKDTNCTTNACPATTSDVIPCSSNANCASYMKFIKYQFWDIFSDILADAGYVLDVAGDIVQALPGVLGWIQNNLVTVLIIAGSVVGGLILLYIFFKIKGYYSSNNTS